MAKRNSKKTPHRIKKSKATAKKKKDSKNRKENSVLAQNVRGNKASNLTTGNRGGRKSGSAMGNAPKLAKLGGVFLKKKKRKVPTSKGHGVQDSKGKLPADYKAFLERMQAIKQKENLAHQPSGILRSVELAAPTLNFSKQQDVSKESSMIDALLESIKDPSTEQQQQHTASMEKVPAVPQSATSQNSFAVLGDSSDEEGAWPSIVLQPPTFLHVPSTPQESTVGTYPEEPYCPERGYTALPSCYDEDDDL